MWDDGSEMGSDDGSDSGNRFYDDFLDFFYDEMSFQFGLFENLQFFLTKNFFLQKWQICIVSSVTIP